MIWTVDRVCYYVVVSHRVCPPSDRVPALGGLVRERRTVKSAPSFHRCFMRRLRINAGFSGLSWLHPDPPVAQVANFFSARVCASIRKVAQPLLKQSKVLHMTDAEMTKSSIRSGGGRDSESSFLHHRSLPNLMAKAEYLLGLDR